MSFRCEISGKQAPVGTKPVVVRYLQAREYQFEDKAVLGTEVVKEVRCLPEEAPEQLEVMLDGLREGKVVTKKARRRAVEERQ